MTDAPPLAPPATFQPLDRRVVTLWRVGTAVSSAIWAGAVLMMSVLLPLPLMLWPMAAAIAIGGALSAMFMAPARYRSWEFRVGDADVRLRHGVFWRTESVVPHVRIQHVDTSHGPVERWLGLGSVILYTAGSVGAALTIPGLALADAEALRDRLAALSGSDDAV